MKALRAGSADLRWNNLALVTVVTVLVLAAGIFTIPAAKSKASEISVVNQSQGSPVIHEIKRLHVKGFINAVAWNKDGSRLATLSLYGSTVTMWETTNWTVVKEFHRYGGGYSQNSLAFLPDGSLLTSAPVGGYRKDATYPDIPAPFNKYETLEIFSLIQWNPVSGVPVRYIPDLGYPPKNMSNKITFTFAVSRDGLLIAGVHGIEVLLYDTASGSLKFKLPVPRTPAHLELWSEQEKRRYAKNPPKDFMDFAISVAFSPDSREIAVGTLSGWVHFFRVKDGTLCHSFEAYPIGPSKGDFRCESIAYSPDGKFIATGKAYNINIPKTDIISTDIWRISNDKKVASLEGSVYAPHGIGMPNATRSLAWSPNGHIIAVCDDGLFRVWQIGDSEPKLLFERKGGTYSTAYSPQGYLAVSSNNEVIILR